ncbi:AAEL002801-PA [Aedes aegypti]|uniref:Uncharacterized protein n=2 Tax=Aedes aegypti TaxID=7159 RepID=Q17H35_AEDAE|nr:uncharacterized protein LOC5576122 [Aedes aegypti]EAT45978.1 AAEL002801-PA [Aedes aegypti]
MVKQCAAMFCGKELDRNDEFYPFPRASPRQTFRLRIWRQRLLVVRALPNQFACARHFSEEQFEARNGSPRELRLDAVPDQNIVRRTIDPEDPLDAVCRLCLERIKSNCHLIHPVWPAPEVPSAEDIEDLFGVVVPNDDLMPRLICVTCVTKVNYVIRIRNQFRKNDAIFNKKWAPKKDLSTKESHGNDRRSSEQDSSSHKTYVENSQKTSPSKRDPISNVSRPTSGQSPVTQTPKIAAVASYGKNPVATSSSSIDPGSERVLNNTFGELVYVQKGNTYQRYQIISSNQIGLSCDREEVVRTSDCRILPADPGDEVEILYTDDNTEISPDAKLVKLEFEPASGFGDLLADDSHLVVEELEEVPEKKPRIDMPFRYDQIKEEPSEDL